MPTYQIILSGKIPATDEVRAAWRTLPLHAEFLGFATTRWVTTAGSDEAIRIAIERVVEELKEKLPIPRDVPMEVEEVSQFLTDDPSHRPGAGFTFYTEPQSQKSTWLQRAFGAFRRQ